jgi:hypothetical protein
MPLKTIGYRFLQGRQVKRSLFRLRLVPSRPRKRIPFKKGLSAPKTPISEASGNSAP